MTKVRGRRGQGVMRIEPDERPVPYARPPALPKLSLYAHESVLRTLRVIAAEEGVQVQALLREAVSEFLDRRGHRFTDLTTGR